MAEMKAERELMNNQALEAAARAICESDCDSPCTICNGRERDVTRPDEPSKMSSCPYLRDAQAAITAYLAALPSDYTELVELLKLSYTFTEQNMAQANIDRDQAADAIGALWTNQITLEADVQLLINRAEAAEAERDEWERQAGAMLADCQAAEARVVELEWALGDVVICWDLPVGLRRSSSSSSYENRMAPHMNRARAALEQANETG